MRTEIAEARQREIRESRRILFPIRLVPFDAIRSWKAFDADVGKEMARELREYFIPDFTEWTNPRRYGETLDRVLRDLRRDSQRPPQVNGQVEA